MSLQSFDDFVARAAAGYTVCYPFWDEKTANVTTILTGSYTMLKSGILYPLPSPLPSGVTAYIPTGACIANHSRVFPVLIGKKISFGTLDIGTNVWTSGSSMPTKTVLNQSINTYSALFMEITAALNSSPGSLNITYVDENGNTVTPAAFSPAASSAKYSCAQFNLADPAVRSVTTANCTGGSSPSGVIEFFGIIPVALFMSGNGASASYGVAENFLTSCVAPTRWDAGDVLTVWFLATSSNAGVKTMAGEITFIGDT